jgi:hypothetical protein
MLLYWAEQHYVRYDWFDIVALTEAGLPVTETQDLIDELIYINMDCPESDDLPSAKFPAHSGPQFMVPSRSADLTGFEPRK